MQLDSLNIIFSSVIFFTLYTLLNTLLDALILNEFLPCLPVHHPSEHQKAFVVPLQSLVTVLPGYTLLDLTTDVLPHRESMPV